MSEAALFSQPSGNPPISLWDPAKVTSDFDGCWNPVGGSMPEEGKAPMDTYKAPSAVTPGWFWGNGPLQHEAFGKTPV